VPLADTSGFRILALKQTKIKMNKTMERAETDRLWPIIETLNWVLNEILVLSMECLQEREREMSF
jgi:hypothetical protein